MVITPLFDTSCPVVVKTLPPFTVTVAPMVEFAAEPTSFTSDIEDSPPDKEKDTRANAGPVNVVLENVTWSTQKAEPRPRVCASSLTAIDDALACSTPNAASP